MMTKLGFHPELIDVVMSYVKTLPYRIKVNGELTNKMKLTRNVILDKGIPLPFYVLDMH